MSQQAARIRISVTAGDISEGRRFDGSNCPVARAFARATESPNVHVNMFGLRVWASDEDRGSGTLRASGRPTQKMVRFINSFDRGLRVKPQNFVVFLTRV